MRDWLERAIRGIGEACHGRERCEAQVPLNELDVALG